MSSDEALQEQQREREKTTETFLNGEGKGEGAPRGPELFQHLHSLTLCPYPSKDGDRVSPKVGETAQS